MSSKMVQLDMFLNVENERKVREEEDFKVFTKKAIRGLFARNNELEFKLLDVSEQLEKILAHMGVE